MGPISSELLAPVIGIPVALCVIGFLVLFIIAKFTRFVFNMMMFITISVVLLIAAAGTGFYLYMNPDTLNGIMPKQVTKQIKQLQPK